MPILRWKDGGPKSPSEPVEVVAGSRVKSGKPLWLWADGYGNPPRELFLFRKAGVVTRTYRHKKGRPVITRHGQPQTVRAHEDGLLSAGPIRLTPGRRVSWTVLFSDVDSIDKAINRSDEIRVSSLVEFEPPQPQAFGFGIRIPIRFVTVIDPVIELSILTPWSGEEWDSYLRDQVADEVAEGESEDEAVAFLQEQVLEGYVPQEPLEGWYFALDEDRFELEEDQGAETMLAVDIPTPGATAFVIQARAMIDGEEILDVSDLIVIRKPEDGEATAELFDGGEGDGGPGEGLEPPADLRFVVGAGSEFAVSGMPPAGSN